MIDVCIVDGCDQEAIYGPTTDCRDMWCRRHDPARHPEVERLRRTLIRSGVLVLACNVFVLVMVVAAPGAPVATVIAVFGVTVTAVSLAIALRSQRRQGRRRP